MKDPDSGTAAAPVGLAPMPTALPPAPPVILLPPHPAEAPTETPARPRPAPIMFLSRLGRLACRVQSSYRRLIFKPKAFFTGMTAPRDRNELAFLAFSAGLATAIGNSEANILAQNAAGHSRDWLLHWLQMIGYGAIGGGIALTLGSYWYRFRLRLAGIKEVPLDLVRRVYLSAAQIVAIPVILKSIIYTFIHDSPFAAALADPTWQTRIYVFFPVWSTVVGYVGVRTALKGRGVRPLLLFLIMPGMFYILFAVFMFNINAYGPALNKGPAPDVDHPREFASSSMAFSYPRNWAIMKGDERYDPQACVQLRPVQDARIGLWLIVPAMSSEEAADSATDAIMGDFDALAMPVPFTNWGDLKGAGRSFEGISERQTYLVRVFFAPVAEERFLYVFEIVNKSALDKVQPGFDLIRRTFRCLRE